jgi:predicted GNAT family acetyltransferase
VFEFCDRFSSRHRHRFEAQLAKDETVFLVRGSVTGHLVGFGTLTVNDVAYLDEKATIIYVGWTMISPEFRKHGITQRLGFNAFLKERLKHPLRNACWMMTLSTPNSYLVLVRNFRDSYPQAGRRFAPRKAAAQAGEGSWLTYSVYAYPHLKLTFPA